MKSGACTHIEAIDSVTPAKAYECEDCVKIGSSWVHLRTCQTCGGTRCCDNSPNRHATKHAHATGQAISNYVTMISGPRRAGEADGPEELHVVFLDNRRRTLLDSLVESARTTAMLFAILTGALMFAEFVNYTSMPEDLKNLVTSFNLSPIMVMAAICAIYVILGTAMEELSMILLTVPVFFPLIVHLGLDPIWFGILIVVVVEIGLISPPVGMNLFVINALLPQVPTRTVFHGVLPFMVADVVRLAILVAFPIISLWLPSLMR